MAGGSDRAVDEEAAGSLHLGLTSKAIRGKTKRLVGVSAHSPYPCG